MVELMVTVKCQELEPPPCFTHPFPWSCPLMTRSVGLPPVQIQSIVLELPEHELLGKPCPSHG